LVRRKEETGRERSVGQLSRLLRGWWRGGKRDKNVHKAGEEKVGHRPGKKQTNTERRICVEIRAKNCSEKK